MIETPVSRSIISRVELRPGMDKNVSVVVTLTGHEMALATDQGNLEKQEKKAQVGFLLVERDAVNKTLTITANATPDEHKTTDQKAADVVEAIYDITKCRLGGMKLEEAAIPTVPLNPNTTYSAAVNIESAIDRSDKSNLVGSYCMEVIRRKQGTRSGIICDPRCDEGTLRLMHVTRDFPNKARALEHADHMLNDLETAYGIYYTRPANLTLVRIKSHAFDEKVGKKADIMAGATDEKEREDLSMTRLLLSGPDDAIDKAKKVLGRQLKSRYFGQIRKKGDLDKDGDLDEDGDLDLVLASTDPLTDQGRLLATVHSKTRCILPVDINPAAVPDEKRPNTFFPCLETPAWEEVPSRVRNSTEMALARYVELQIPSTDTFVTAEPSTNETGKSHPARVIIHKPCSSQTEALDMARTLGDRVSARLRRGEELHLS